MFRESERRCGVERCQMVYITAGERQGERKRLQNTNTERKETRERQISITKPGYISQYHFSLQYFSLETIDLVSIEPGSSQPDQPVSYGKCLHDYMTRRFSKVKTLEQLFAPYFIDVFFVFVFVF